MTVLVSDDHSIGFIVSIIMAELGCVSIRTAAVCTLHLRSPLLRVEQRAMVRGQRVVCRHVVDHGLEVHPVVPHHHGPGVRLPDVVEEAVAEVGVEAAGGAGVGAALRAADRPAVAARHEAQVPDTRRAHVRGHQVLQQLGHVHASAALGTGDVARMLGEAPAVSRQL